MLPAQYFVSPMTQVKLRSHQAVAQNIFNGCSHVQLKYFGSDWCTAFMLAVLALEFAVQISFRQFRGEKKHIATVGSKGNYSEYVSSRLQGTVGSFILRATRSRANDLWKPSCLLMYASIAQACASSASQCTLCMHQCKTWQCK